MKKNQNQDNTAANKVDATSSATGAVKSLAGYEEFLRDIKTRVQSAQTRAALAVNSELVLLYWSIGRDILTRQQEQGWGAKVIERLSSDLRREFPTSSGFSTRNLKYMRAFAEAWPGEPIVQAALAQTSNLQQDAAKMSSAQPSNEPPLIVQQLVAQLPWGHNVRLLDYLHTPEERLWYAQQAIENGWSRNVLVHQVESKLYARQGKAVTNFDRALPAPQSDLANQLLKDPYNFDFLTLGRDAEERDLERGLLVHIRKFLLELGAGFVFLGSQYHLEFDEEDYFLDLLFYHVKLRCYVVIELKSGKFQPEYAGKMNFYLAVLAVETGSRLPCLSSFLIQISRSIFLRGKRYRVRAVQADSLRPRFRRAPAPIALAAALPVDAFDG